MDNEHNHQLFTEEQIELSPENRFIPADDGEDLPDVNAGGVLNETEVTWTTTRDVQDAQIEDHTQTVEYQRISELAAIAKDLFMQCSSDLSLFNMVKATLINLDEFVTSLNNFSRAPADEAVLPTRNPLRVQTKPERRTKRPRNGS